VSVSPSVFPYDDPRRYVRDWLQHRPRLSQRWLARKVESSPARVSMVLNQQRALPLDVATTWAKAMGLEGEEASHFEAMVAAENAPTEALREEAKRQVRAGQDFARATPLDSATNWLGSWVHLALLEAARHPSFDGRPEPLAARLWPPVDVETVEAAIADLLASGVLVRSDSGWRTDERPLRTALRVRDRPLAEAVAHMHHEQLAHASQALDALPGPSRHVVSVTVGLAKDRVPHLLEAVRTAPLHLASPHADDLPETIMEIVVAAYPRTVDPA